MRKVMPKTKEQNIVYAVLVLRTDQNHITVLESANYDECFNCWSELTAQWKETAKEGSPFQITNPIVTSFSPGMITEITVVPVQAQNQALNDNPYQKDMMKEGFANTFGRNTGVLDNGYKRN